MNQSRGVSEVTGFALITAITVVSVSAVLLIGGTALEDTQDTLETDRAELVAGEFYRSLVEVADGNSPTRRIEMGGLSASVRPERGWMRISVGGTTLANETLGLVQFSDGQQYIVVQGGAIIRVDGDQAILRNGPEVRYRNQTLMVSVLRVRGDADTDRHLLVHAGGREQVFPDPDADMTNPVENDPLTLTIRSEYYRAWGAYFAERMNLTPTYDDAAKTVSVTFVPERSNGPVEAGVVAGAPSSTLTLSGGMSLDSYDSRTGPYTGGDDEGRVVSAGSIEVRGGATLDGGVTADGDVVVTGGGTLNGPVAAGGDLTVSGGGTIDSDDDGDGVRVAGDVTVDWGTTFEGELVYGGTLTDPGGEVSDATNDGVSVSVDAPSPVGSRITETLTAARAENDNASTRSIDAGELDCSYDEDADNLARECLLTAGTYYLDSLSLSSNEELILDASGGDVTLAVDGDVSLGGNSEVRVVGDGRVNVYVAGDYDQVGSGRVVNAGDDAPQFWMYFYDDATVDLNGGGRFVGVIYAPGAAVDVGSVPVYGAVVGDISFVASGVEIHYDAALTATEPIPVDSSASPIQYVHAEVERLNVSADGTTAEDVALAGRVADPS